MKKPFGQFSPVRLQSRKRLIGPVKCVPIFWGFIILNYFLGPNSYTFPALITFLYFVFLTGTFLLGASFGFGGALLVDEQQMLFSSNCLIRWRKISLVFAWISGLAAALSVAIYMQTGHTLDNAINNTGMVQHRQYEDSSKLLVVTNAFGFFSYSWFFLSVLFIRFDGGIRNVQNSVRLIGSLIGVGAILVFYALNASRNAYMTVFVMGICYVAIAEGGRFLKVVRKMRVKWVVILGVVGLALMSYILFISVSRTGGASENPEFVDSNMKLKYHFTFIESIDYDLACGIYKLQWYVSSPLRNFDIILQNGVPLINFNPANCLQWPIMQATKVFPDANIIRQVNEANNYTEIISPLGENMWQWATGFCGIICDFGLFGSILFMGVAGWFITHNYRCFLNGSIVSGLLCMWSLIFCMDIIIFFPLDNFIQSNFYILLIVKAGSFLFKSGVVAARKRKTHPVERN